MKILVVEVGIPLSEEQTEILHDYVKGCIDEEKILILPDFCKSYVAEIDDVEVKPKDDIEPICGLLHCRYNKKGVCVAPLKMDSRPDDPFTCPNRQIDVDYHPYDFMR